MVVSESPSITGVIGVSERPMSKPRRPSSALNRRVLAHRRSMQLGLLDHDPDRLAAGGGDGRRMRVENRNGRARWIRMSRSACDPAT